MRVSIRLGTKAVSSVEVPEDKASLIYRNLSYMLHRYMDPAKTDELMDDQSDQPQVAVPEGQVITKEPNVLKASVRDHSPGERKKVFFHKCPDCEKVSFTLSHENAPEVKCICGKIYKLENLKPASALCACCGNASMVQVAEGTPYIKCRNRKAPIDLIWNDKKGSYESAGRKAG